MAQYVYTMNRVGKIVPPKREILRDISLSFFPGAKIGVLGLNGSGKSTLLRIMAGVDQDIEGEARPMPGLKVGFLPQEPALDENKNVRENVQDGLREPLDALAGLDQVYADYAEADADFDALAKKQSGFEDIIQAWDAHNLYLSLLGQYGLAGFALITGAVVTLVRALIRDGTARRKAALLLALFAVAVHGIAVASEDFRHVWALLGMVGLAGMPEWAQGRWWKAGGMWQEGDDSELTLRVSGTENA